MQDAHMEPPTLYHMLHEGVESERIKVQSQQALGNNELCSILEIRILQTERLLSLMRLSSLDALTG